MARLRPNAAQFCRSKNPNESCDKIGAGRRREPGERLPVRPGMFKTCDRRHIYFK